jgi:hypothetical protein
MAACPRMESTVFIVLLAFTGLALTQQEVSQEPSVELTIQPPGGIKQGDEVTITCTAYGKQFLDVVRLVRAIDGEDFEININGVNDEKYQETGRYNAAEYKEEDGIGVVKVTITNIQGDDGGNIGCKLLGQIEKGAYEDIIVDVPPKNVTLKYQDKDGTIHVVDDDTPIRLEYGYETGIICESYVAGSDMEPTMDVFLDDKKITSRFTNDYESDNTHVDGMRTLYYHKTLSYLVEEPDVKEHGKKVKCSSKMPQFDALTAEADLEVIYAPNLDCPTKYYAKIGDTDVKVPCKSGMNPGPLNFSFSWGKKPNRTTLNDGESEGGFTVSKEDLGNNEYEFILTIDELTEYDFRKYKLNVESELGQSEISISLREEEETTSTSTTTSSTTTLVQSLKDPGNEGKTYPDDNSADGLGRPGCSQLMSLVLVTFISWLISTV